MILPTFQQPPKQITIWIHGTRGKHIFPTNLTEKTRISEYTFGYSPPGLHTVKEIDEDLYIRTIIHTLNQANSTLFPLEHTYSFGWSGELDPRERLHEAEQLYMQLITLKNDYIKNFGSCPPITLITHSHGGNVALNLGAVAEKNLTDNYSLNTSQNINHKLSTNSPHDSGNTLSKDLSHHTSHNLSQNLSIDRLILLACPVQEETAPCIASPLFKKVYSLYSKADTIQVLDPQGIHPLIAGIQDGLEQHSFAPIKDALKEKPKKLFSKRQFAFHPKLKQVQLIWEKEPIFTEQDLIDLDMLGKVMQKIYKACGNRKRGLMHIDFILPPFLRQLPAILTSIETDAPQENGESEIIITL